MSFNNESSYGGLQTCSEQALSAPFLRIITVIYVVLFLLGTIGNILVITVIIKHREMRSSTNYFLINLCVADLLVLLICMPVGLGEMYVGAYFPFSEAMCYIVQLSDYIAPQASTLTLLSVAAERYFAICTPFKAQYMFTPGRTLIACVSTWIISIVTCIPAMHSVEYSECVSSSGELKPTCAAYVTSGLEKMYIVSVNLVFFVMPCVVLAGIYFIIGKTLRNHDMLMASVSHQPPSRTSSDAADQEEDSGPMKSSKWNKILSCAPCLKTKSKYGGRGYYHQMPSHAKRKLERFNSVNGSVCSDVSSTDYEYIEITMNPRTSRKKSDTSDRNQSRDLPPIKEEDAEYLSTLTKNVSVSNVPSVQTIRSTPQTISTSRPVSKRKSHGKLIFMLGTVVVVFFVCWLPFRVIALWQISSDNAFANINFDTLLFFIFLARIMVYINSAINPLLYNLISTKFRSAFKSTISCVEMPTSKPIFSKAPSSSSLRQTLRGK